VELVFVVKIEKPNMSFLSADKFLTNSFLVYLYILHFRSVSHHRNVIEKHMGNLAVSKSS
jgi:hypothetical protein